MYLERTAADPRCSRAAEQTRASQADHRCRPKNRDSLELRKAVKRVIEGVHVVPMGMANAFLIETDDGLTLIDAGFPGKGGGPLRGGPRAWPFARPSQAPDFHSRPS